MLFFIILEPAKLLVSTLMKNTALIDDRDLAFETYLVNCHFTCELQFNNFFFFIILFFFPVFA